MVKKTDKEKRLTPTPHWTEMNTNNWKRGFKTQTNNVWLFQPSD